MTEIERAPEVPAAPAPEQPLESLGEIRAVGHGQGSTRTHEPSDPDERVQNRQRCEARSMEGCHAAALDAYYSPSTLESDRDALSYFERACSAGYAPSCNGLGVLRRSGRGARADPVEAERLFRIACESGVSTGCVHLEDMLRSRDPRAADRALRRTECLRALAPDAGPTSCPALSP